MAAAEEGCPGDQKEADYIIVPMGRDGGFFPGMFPPRRRLQFLCPLQHLVQERTPQPFPQAGVGGPADDDLGDLVLAGIPDHRIRGGIRRQRGNLFGLRAPRSCNCAKSAPGSPGLNCFSRRFHVNDGQFVVGPTAAGADQFFTAWASATTYQESLGNGPDLRCGINFQVFPAPFVNPVGGPPQGDFRKAIASKKCSMARTACLGI